MTGWGGFPTKDRELHASTLGTLPPRFVLGTDPLTAASSHIGQSAALRRAAHRRLRGALPHPTCVGVRRPQRVRALPHGLERRAFRAKRAAEGAWRWVHVG